MNARALKHLLVSPNEVARVSEETGKLPSEKWKHLMGNTNKFSIIYYTFLFTLPVLLTIVIAIARNLMPIFFNSRRNRVTERSATVSQ